MTKNKSLLISVFLHIFILALIFIISIKDKELINEKNNEPPKQEITKIKTTNIRFSKIKSEKPVKTSNSDEKKEDKTSIKKSEVKSTQKTKPPTNSKNFEQKKNAKVKKEQQKDKKPEKKENAYLDLLGDINKTLYQKPYDNTKKEKTKQSYVEKIQAKIYSNWNQSYGKKGWQCRVQVIQSKSGKIIEHQFIDCPYNKDFKRTVSKAIESSSPLPLPEKVEDFDELLDFVFFVD